MAHSQRNLDEHVVGLTDEQREFLERTPRASSGFEYAYWTQVEGRGAFVYGHEDHPFGSLGDELERMTLKRRKPPRRLDEDEERCEPEPALPKAAAGGAR